MRLGKSFWRGWAGDGLAKGWNWLLGAVLQFASVGGEGFWSGGALSSRMGDGGGTERLCV